MSKNYCCPWNMTNEEFFEMEQIILAQAKDRDEQAARTVFWMGLVLDTERAEYHEDIVFALLKSLGDEHFKESLSREPFYVRASVASYLDVFMGFDDVEADPLTAAEAKAKYPVTWGYLKRHLPKR